MNATATIRAMMVCLLLLSGPVMAESISNGLGWTISASGEDGTYTIAAKDPGWTIGGTVGKSVGKISASAGTDKIGEYKELSFHYREEGNRTTGIRLYEARPVVIFSTRFEEAVKGCPAAFPVLTKLPGKLLEFRYGETDHLRPESFHLAAKNEEEMYGGPFALFDEEARCMIVSPADDFMIARTSGGQTHGIAVGFNQTLQGVPAGYTASCIVTMADGINRAWDVWGNALTDLHGKKRPANDADTGLKYLGFWTDNGAAYYYNYDLAKGYEQTLLDLKKHWDEIGLPIHYLQLDSWWYPKSFNSVQAGTSNKPRSKDPKIPAGTWNRYGGLLEYVPHPDLFPHGLAEFHEKLGLPFITHNRWIDPESVYHKDYKISGIAAIDPKFWEMIATNLQNWGVTTYEQDWSNYIYNRSPELYSTTWAGDMNMDSMAAACAAHGLTMQYCMVLPRHLMEGGSKYPNLTTVRVSTDRFSKERWHEFLYGSRMASALGVWPWTDVFKSKETANILLCNLSAGMMGLSDKMGTEDLTNIFRTARKDGVIVKPTEPIVPMDETVIAEATATENQTGENHVGGNPVVACSTFTSHGDSRAAYVFAYRPKTEAATWEMWPKKLGFDGDVYSYDFFGGGGELIAAGGKQTVALKSEENMPAWGYRVVAPVGESGMALIGDVDKFVTRGRQRIAEIHEKSGELQTTVLFAKGETSVTLAAYCPKQPAAEAVNGACAVQYDDKTKIARIEVKPDISAAGVVDGDSVIAAKVTIHLGR